MSEDDTREAPPQAEQLASSQRDAPGGEAGISAMMTVQDISECLGLSEKHVRREIKRKKLVVHRFGRLVRVAPEDLKIYIAARRRAPR